MCGIVGIIGNRNNVGAELLMGLKRLEYRGYDSVGIAVLKKNGEIDIRKDVGTVQEVGKKLKLADVNGILGIGHTRWATTGAVTKQNAHPHTSCNNDLVVVHNGIIENYQEIKRELEVKGHKFSSDTDSEVIVHYFEEKLKMKNLEEACVDFLNDFEGTFAILLIGNREEKIYAIKRDSPLVLGICDGHFVLSSDIYTFSNKTNKAIFFENDEFAVIEKDEYRFYNKNGEIIRKEITEFEWQQEESEIQNYPHYMIKEIKEEPKVVKRLLISLKTDQKKEFDKLIELIENSRKVTFVAAGTSYHASLLGVYYLHRCEIEAQTIIASEFEHFISADEKTLVVAISQSGETMDVIDALKYAKKKGAKIASIVNVPYSTIQRMSDISLNILAGQEVCVAATKSFVNQVTLLLAVAKEFGFEINLEDLPEKIESVFKLEEKIKEIAKNIHKNKDIYIIGRGLSYPVAREMALKIKEISYIHAEGMMGGELKHGTIALIEKETPVISLISNSDQAMLANTKEVEARGARVITITDEIEGDIKLDTQNDGKFGILATVVGQLLTYYIALEKELLIDKPRNLAKSVTVK